MVKSNILIILISFTFIISSCKKTNSFHFSNAPLIIANDGSVFKYTSSEGEYLSNKKIGIWKYFDDARDIVLKEEYIKYPNKNKIILNQQIYFKDDAIIENISTYYDFNVEDTLRLNKEYMFEIKFNFNHTSKEFVLGESKFTWIKITDHNFQEIKGKDFPSLELNEFIFLYKFEKLGEQNFNAIIEEQNYEIQQDSTEIRISNMFLSKKFYVIE
ncbi:MAG: hypothetical protein COB73_08420 [Flavobacteriaceae bacterium]|nr:MAG: hypothetical protein COB73_08420 [Flavobacteriaceae bacterium]